MLSMDRSKLKTHQRHMTRVKTLSPLFSMCKPMPAVCGARQTWRADAHNAIVLFSKILCFENVRLFHRKDFCRVNPLQQDATILSWAFQSLQLAWCGVSVLDFWQGLFG